MHAQGDVVAYRRVLDGAQVLVIFNAGQAAARVMLPAGGLREVVFGAPSDLTLGDKETQLTAPARSGVVLM